MLKLNENLVVVLSLSWLNFSTQDSLSSAKDDTDVQLAIKTVGFLTKMRCFYR